MKPTDLDKKYGYSNSNNKTLKLKNDSVVVSKKPKTSKKRHRSLGDLNEKENTGKIEELQPRQFDEDFTIDGKTIADWKEYSKKAKKRFEAAKSLELVLENKERALKGWELKLNKHIKEATELKNKNRQLQSLLDEVKTTVQNADKTHGVKEKVVNEEKKKGNKNKNKKVY